MTFRGTNSDAAAKNAASELRGDSTGSRSSTTGKSSEPKELPLFEAIKAQNIDKVRSLIKESKTPKEDIVNEDERGMTPLIEATLTGNISLVKLLTDAGAPAQPAKGFRHTPLRAACLTGNVPLIGLLLKEGADPNAKSEGDRTPLMGACYLRPGYSAERSLPAVEAMLQDGRTDPTIANTFGETALDLCKQRNYVDSAKVLEAAIAKRRKGTA